MNILYFLESIRTPLGDTFFSIITHLGEETFFILFGLVFFWCINKKEGYYLLTIGFMGTIINQFLKLWFRIPRPWVKDPDFQPVSAAIKEATGYSFPSGHTQSSVGIFGAIARWHDLKWLRIICIALCVLVPFSRLYLGVHTFLDVSISLIIALLLIFVIYPIIYKAGDCPKTMRILFTVMIAMSVILLIFVCTYPFPADVDAENLAHGIKNAYKMLGCSLGIFIAYEVDNRYIHFDTKASLPAQILKLLIGLIPLLLIKEGMRAPLALIFGESYVADGIRYLLLVLFAGCIWPLTFKKFSKMFSKNGKEPL